MWAFDEVVEQVAGGLPLYLTAAVRGLGGPRAQTFINLDMEEYRDLDLTIAVFTHLEDPRLRTSKRASCCRPTCPTRCRRCASSPPGEGPRRPRRCADQGAPREGRQPRHGAGGGRAARLDARPYDTKIDTDANYLRCLDAALTPERCGRCASASPGTTSSTSRTRGCSPATAG
jgi:RHH-type proline utilization regulon transcriptional repressor/proline dehydrogenase/delta 1-pyrroline-5-carboxylate dehydrogenase